MAKHVYIRGVRGYADRIADELRKHGGVQTSWCKCNQSNMIYYITGKLGFITGEYIDSEEGQAIINNPDYEELTLDL